MKLGTKVKLQTGAVQGEVWCLSLGDQTCIVRYETTKGKVWLSGWIPIDSVTPI